MGQKKVPEPDGAGRELCLGGAVQVGVHLILAGRQAGTDPRGRLGAFQEKAPVGGSSGDP